MTEEGVWNIVMQDGRAGKKGMLIVPEEMLTQYIGRGMVIGVCSTSPDEGFLVYRKKKKYNEWAVYVGEQIDKEMPELKFVVDGDDEEGEDPTGSSTPEKSDTDGRSKTDGRG